MWYKETDFVKSIRIGIINDFIYDKTRASNLMLIWTRANNHILIEMYVLRYPQEKLKVNSASRKKIIMNIYRYL